MRNLLNLDRCLHNNDNGDNGVHIPPLTLMIMVLFHKLSKKRNNVQLGRGEYVRIVNQKIVLK